MEVLLVNQKNLFDNIEYHEKEITDLLLTSPHVRIERILSSGQTSEIYDQDEHEWVAVLEGEAEILFVDENERIRLYRGDHLLIPKGRRHQVTYTSNPCLWLCVFWGECATL